MSIPTPVRFPMKPAAPAGLPAPRIAAGLPAQRIAASLLPAVVWLGCVLGCASWSHWDQRDLDPQAESTVAGKTVAGKLKRVRRTIEIETRFVQVRFDPADPDPVESIWQWVDETVIPPDVRQRLHHNGLRVGKAIEPERMSARIRSLETAEAADIVDQFLASASIASHQSEGSKRTPMRIGKRYELPVRLPIEGNHVVLVDADPQPIGRTLRDPQFLFAVTPQRGETPSAISLRLRPEIQHGQMRQDWVQGDAALRIDVRRQCWSLEELDFELTGGEGDLFVIAETQPRKGLGKAMLGGENVDRLQEQTLVLLKIDHVPTPGEQL